MDKRMGFTECTACQGYVLSKVEPSQTSKTALELRVDELEAKVLELERRTIGSMLVGGYQG